MELYRSCRAQSSAKPLWAALESSLSTILVSLKKPPPYLTNGGSTNTHTMPPLILMCLWGLLIALWVLTFCTDRSGRAHPVSHWPLVSPGAVGLGCVMGWYPGVPGQGRRRWRARRAQQFCPSGCCCLCCPSLRGRLPALGWACKTRRAEAEAERGLMGGHGAPFPRAALKTHTGQSHPGSNACAVPCPTPEQDAGNGSRHLVRLSFSPWCCFSWHPHGTFLQNSIWKAASLPCLPFCTHIPVTLTPDTALHTSTPHSYVVPNNRQSCTDFPIDLPHHIMLSYPKGLSASWLTLCRLYF